MSRLFIGRAYSAGPFLQIWPEESDLQPGFVQEGKDYFLELRGIGNPDDVRLLLEGEELTALRSPDRETARWLWSPGFYAGEVQFTLVIGKGEERSISVITDPDLRKLTRTSFDIMVRDILEDTTALFALSAHRSSVASGDGSITPPLARLEYLYSRFEQIERVVKDIERRPVRYLRSVSKLTPVHRVRKASSREILSSLRGSSIQKEKRYPSRLPPAFNGYFPRAINARFKSDHMDIKEHQEIKSALMYWASWLSVIVDRLAKEGGRKSRFWERKCRNMLVRMQRLLTLPVFRGVEATGAQPSISSIYRRLPAYRSFFKLYHEFRLGLVNLVGDYLNLPLARTFDLYELWCFFRILRAACLRFGNEDLDVDQLLEYDKHSGRLTVPAKALKVRVDKGLLLCFQASYKEFWKLNSRRGSYSREMRPDITVDVSPDATVPRLIVLDAKYRIKEELNEALSSIHMYRDAIVQQSLKGTEQVVSGAYLISPYLFQAGDSWEDASKPDRFFYPEYRQRFRFGAISLVPGISLEQTGDLLDEIVEHSVKV